MAVDILYFAWVREAVGTGAERLELPEDVLSVSDLIEWLAKRSGGHAAAMAEPTRLRAAVDQRFAPLNASIAGAREIALFPPVTGG